jgi:hypothetical protein
MFWDQLMIRYGGSIARDAETFVQPGCNGRAAGNGQRTVQPARRRRIVRPNLIVGLDGPTVGGDAVCQ